MSAEVLRRAAALMRERAEAATPGPWFALDGSAIFNPSVATRPGSVNDLESREWVAEAAPSRDEGRGRGDAEHIASWHPAVALAVADWLDAEAAKQTPTTHLAVTFGGAPMFPVDPHALAVARAYLGVAS